MKKCSPIIFYILFNNRLLVISVVTKYFILNNILNVLFTEEIFKLTERHIFNYFDK